MKNLLKFDGLKKEGMHENLGKINISFKDEQTDNTVFVNSKKQLKCY